MTEQFTNSGMISTNKEKLNTDSSAFRAVADPISQNSLNDLNQITTSMYQALSGEVNPFQGFQPREGDPFDEAIARNQREIEAAQHRIEGRTFAEKAKDTGLGIAKSVNVIAEQAYGLANLGSIGLDRLAGGDGSSSLDGALGWGQNFRDTREIYNQLQSESLQARREAMQNRMAQYSDEREQRMALRAEEAGRGHNNAWDMIQDVAGEAHLAMKELWQDKGLLADSVLETGLSYLVPGAVAGGLRRAGFGVLGRGREGLRQNLSESQIRRRLASENAGIGSISIAGMEGSSNAMEARQRVLEMSEEQLIQQSPIYADLIETHSKDIAREIVANNVFSTTFGIAGSIAGASAGITGAGRLEAGLFRRTGRGLVKGTPGAVVGAAAAAGQESAQELFQSGGGQLAQNMAIRQFADIDQSVLEDVGTAAGMGMITGGAMGGGASIVANTAPSVSASARGVIDRAEKGKARGEAIESIKKRVMSAPLRNMLDPNRNEYAPATAISQMMDKRTLSQDELNDPERFQEHLITVQTELANARSTSMTKIQEMIKNAPEGTNVKETKEFQDEFANYNALNEQQSVLNKITKDSLEKSRAFDRYDEIINDIAQRTDTLSDEDVSGLFEVFGSSPESVTPEILSQLENSPNEQVRQRAAIHRAAQETQQLIEQNTKKGIAGVNRDVIDGGPGFMGIRQYMSDIQTAFRLGNTESAQASLQAMSQFAVSHNNKASLAQEIYQGLNRNEDVSDLQEQYTESYSTRDFDGNIVKSATVHSKSGRMVKALQDEANVLNAAVMEAQAIVNSLPQATTAETVQESTQGDREASTPDFTQARFTPEGIQEAQSLFPDFGEAETTTEQTPQQEVAEDVAPSEQSVAPEATQSEDTTTEQLRQAIQETEQETRVPSKKELEQEVTQKAEEELSNTAETLNTKGYRVPKKEVEKLNTALSNQLKKQVTRLPMRSIVNSAKAFSTGVADAFSGTVRQNVKNPWYKSGVEQARKRLLPGFHAMDRVFIRNVGDKFGLNFSNIFTRSKPKTPLQTTENLFQEILNNPGEYLANLQDSEPATFDALMRFHKRIEKALTAQVKSGKYKYLGDLTYESAVLADPTRLLLNEDGTFDPNVVTAIAITSFNWLQENAFDLSGNSEQLTRAHLGLDSSASMPINEHVSTVRGFGMVASWAQQSMGKALINTLGLRDNKQSTHPEMYQKMTTALGQTALDLLATEEVGVIRSQSVANQYYQETIANALEQEIGEYPNTSVALINLRGKQSDEGFVPVKAVDAVINEDTKLGYAKVAEKLFEVETEKQMPTFDGPMKFKQKKLKRSPMDVPKKVAKSVQKLMDQPIQYKQTNMKIAEFMGEAMILDYAGFVEDINSLPKYKQENTARGSNPAIKREYDAMVKFFENAQDREFYVGHEVWKNFRIGMVGPINMQASKMHRHMMAYSAHVATIEPGDTVGHKYFKLALAQHFGFDIDKQSAARSLEQLEAMLSQPEFIAAKESILALERDGDSMTPEVIKKHRRAIDDAMLLTKETDIAAFDALINWAKSSESETFTTDLFIEIDGVTNGPILGLTQLMPYNKTEMKRRLNAGGIYFGDQWSDFSQYKEDGQDDTYEVLGVELQKALSEIMKKESAGIQQGMNLLIQMTSKEARKLAKDPTMITTYGAGRSKVINDTVQALIEGMYDNILTDERDHMVQAMEAFGVRLTTKQYDQLENNPSEFILNQAQKRYLSNELSKSFGSALSTALGKTYGGFIEYQRTMNRAINLNFKTFEEAFNLKVKERLTKERETNPGLKELNQEIQEEIFNDLLDMAPLIKTMFSTGIADSYLAMKTDRSINMDNSYRTIKQYNAPITHSIHNKKSVKQSTGRPEKMKFIEAGVSGFVSLVHATDAAIIVNTIETQSVLNVHDAIGVSVTDAVHAAADINKNFFNIMSEYSVPKEIENSLTSSIDRLVNMVGESRVDALVVDMFTDAQIDNGAPTTAQQFIGEFAALTDSIETRKQELLSEVTHVGQYHLVDASVDIVEMQERRTEQETVETLAEEFVNELTREEAEDAQILRQAREQEIFNVFGSSGASFTGFTATDQVTVTPGNSMNLLHRLIQQDGSTISDSHGEHLGRVLGNVVNKVLNPIQVAIQDMAPETKGRYFTKQNRIEIALANPVFNQSQQTQAEVYAHEMMHVVTHYGLEQDSPARRVLQRFYNAVGNHVTVEDFYPNNPTQVQKDQAQRLYDYVFNNTQKAPVRHVDPITGAATTHHKNASLHEFLAYATTNQRMIEAMNAKADAINQDMIKVPGYTSERRTTKGGVVPQIFTNIVNWLMDKVAELFNSIQMGRLKLKGLTPQEAMLKIAEDISAMERDAVGNMVKRKGLIDRADTFVIQKIEQFVLQPIKRLGGSRYMRDSQFSTIRSIGGIMENAPTMDKQSFMDGIRTVTRRMGLMHDSIIVSLAREMRGQHAGNRKFYGLMRRSKVLIDQLAKRIGISTKTLIHDMYANELTQEEKVAVNQLLKVDLSSLLITDTNLRTQTNSEIDDAMMGPGGKQARTNNMSNIQRLLEDSDYRSQEIQRLTDEIYNIKGIDRKTATFYVEQAIGLGHKMQSITDGMAPDQLSNAYAITQLAGSAKWVFNKPADTDTAQILIDQLATIKGLDLTDTAQLELSAQVLRKELDAGKSLDENGLTFTLRMHSQFKKDSMNTLFGASPMQMTKGWTKQIIDPSIKLMVAPESHAKQLQRQGFKMVGMLNDDQDNPQYRNTKEPMMLYRSTSDKDATWQKMIVSMSRDQAQGSGFIRAYETNNEFGMYGEDNGQSLDDAIKAQQQIRAAKARKVAQTGNQPRKHKGEMLVPVINDEGDITGYRYMMNQDTRAQVLIQNENFDEVLSQMHSTLSTKSNSVTINRETVEALKEEYDNNFSKDPTRFVKLATDASGQPNPREGRNAQEYQDMWNMLPHKMQQDVKKIFGEEALYVPEDLYKLVFGYRKNNMRDFSKRWEQRANSRVMKEVAKHLNSIFSHRAFMFTEDVWKELVSMAKDAIVIKSGAVLVANVTSNTLMLLMSGVSPKALIQHHRDGYRYVREYQDLTHKVDKIRQRIKVDKSLSKSKKQNLEAQVARIENELQNNPARELLDAGVYQSIVEDVSLEEDPFTFKSRMEKFVDPAIKRTPQVIKDLGNTMFITHDTQMYKALRNTTQISDFVARYTLHKVNTERGMSFQESVNDIMDSFIDYESPTHEAIQYANEVGGLMFTKFFFRIQKMLAKRLSDRPASTLTYLLLQQAIGYNLSDVFDEGGWNAEKWTNRAYTPDHVFQSIMNGNLMEFSLTSGMGRPM